jgi:hypothetical protein
MKINDPLATDKQEKLTKQVRLGCMELRGNCNGISIMRAS